MNTATHSGLGVHRTKACDALRLKLLLLRPRLRNDAQTPGALLLAADNAELAAKLSGKNVVGVAAL